MAMRYRRRVGQIWLCCVVNSVAANSQAPKPEVVRFSSAASYEFPAAGGIAILFGTGLGPRELVASNLAGGTLPTTLDGVQVVFGGTPARLIYVSDTQTAFVVPFSANLGPAWQVPYTFKVIHDGIGSDPVVSGLSGIRFVSPGIFTLNAQGFGQAAALNVDGSLNSPSRPVKPGGIVSIFLTGCGPTNPPGVEGEIASSAAKLTQPVEVTFAGRPAEVLYAGTSPGSIHGLTQINFKVPGDLRFGGYLPVIVSMSVDGNQLSSQKNVLIAVEGEQAPTPGTPANLKARFTLNQAVEVSWTPADNLAKYYYIESQVGPNGGNRFTGDGIRYPGNITSILTQTNRTPIYFQIRAESEYGLFSPYSNIVGPENY